MAAMNELYKTLFESSHDGIYIVDAEGAISQFNDAALELFGFQEEDVPGLHVSQLFADPQVLQTLLDTVQKTGHVREYEAVLRCKDDTLIDCVLSTSLQRNAKGEPELYWGIVHDISQRKYNERQLAQRNQELELLNELNQNSLLSLNETEILQQLLRQAVTVFDATSAYISQFDEDERTEVVIAEFYGAAATAAERISDLHMAYPLGDQFADRVRAMQTEPFFTTYMQDVEPTHWLAAHMAQFEAQAILGIPLVAKGALLGLLEIWESRPGRMFTPEEINLAQLMGRQTAVALHNAQLYQQSQQEIRERQRVEKTLQQSEESARIAQDKLQALQEINLELSRLDSLDEIYQQAVVLGRERLDFDRMGLLLYDEATNTMRGTFGTDDQGQLRDERYFQQEVDDADVLKIIHERQRAGVWQDKTLRDGGKVIGSGWNVMAGMWYEDTILGWLAADNLLTKTPLESYTINLLVLYASTLAHLIVRQKAEDAMRRSQEQLRRQNQALVELAKSEAINTGDLDATFQIITEIAANIIQVARVSIWDYEADKISCMNLYEAASNMHSDGIVLHEKDFPAYFQAIRSDRTLAAHDAHNDPRTAEFSAIYLTPLGIGALLDAGAQISGQTKAILCLEHVGPARTWTLEEQNFSNSLADLLSLALEAAQRHQLEGQIKDREALLQLVLDTIPQSVFWKDRQYRYLGSNQRFARAVGVESPKDLIGKTDRDLVWDPERAEFFIQVDEGVMAANKPQLRFVEPQPRGDKQAFLETNKVPLHDDDGQVIGILGTYEDITERIEAEQRLKESQQRLALLVQQSPLAVIEWDLNFCVVEWNLAAERIFGYTREQAMGQYAAFIIPEQDRAYVDDVWQGLLAQQGGTNTQNQNVTSDGRSIMAEWYNTPLLNEAGEVIGVASLVQDITEQQLLQSQVQESLVTRDRQLEISRILTAARTEEEVFAAIVDNVDIYPHVAVSLTLLQAEEEVLIDVVVAQNEYQSGIQMTSLGTKRPHKDSPLAQHYSAETPYITPDIRQDERLPEALRQGFAQAHIASMAILPIVTGGEWLGNLVLLTQEKDFFNDHTLVLFRTVAEQGAIALRANRLYAETESALARREREVVLSTQIAQDIASATGLQDLYQRVVTQIHEQFGYYHTQLLRYDPAMQTVALIVGYGEVGQKMLEMNHSLPYGVGLIGMTAATGRSLLRPNLTTDPDWQSNPLLPAAKGELAVPIKLGHEVLGVLDVQSDRVNALDENDQLVLEGLCGQIAIAIESTTLREDMESRLRELNSLQRQMSREGWSVYQQSKEAVRGYQFDHGGVKPLVMTGIKGGAQTNGTAVKQKANGQHTAVQTSSSSTALQIRGETIGVFGVLDDDKPLTEDEREFITAVSLELAEALEAARLFEQTNNALSEQQRLTAELATVAQVSAAASTILDVDALLQAVVDLSKSSFNLYHVHIYLLNENGNRLILKAGAGNIGRLMTLEGREISTDAQSIVAKSVRTRQGVIVGNVRKSIDFLAHPLLPNTQSEMAVPMIVGDRIIGVLDLQSDKLDSFTDEDLNIQRTLASQIAIAIENARQYVEQVEISEKLREVDRLKSEFLASMSHELRTPLNSIIGFADVLLEGLDGDLNERMEEDVRLIRDSGRHLRELIGDILDMSKIEAGRMELRYEEIDLRQMANDIMATAQPLANQKSLSMHLDLDPKVGFVTADRTRLRQVLWNIMGNAIKFTEKGSVSLSLQDRGDHVLFAIRDSGIGIKEENIPIVFEQFRQIDGGLNRSASGTGLGMPITKKLVEIHGGEIWIESVYGQGSTFLFTVPYNPPQQKPTSQSALRGV